MYQARQDDLAAGVEVLAGACECDAGEGAARLRPVRIDIGYR